MEQQTGSKLGKEYVKAVYCNPAYLSSMQSIFYAETSLVAQMLKRLPTMRETWVQSLGWEDLLEKEMATHSSILTWKIPWTEEPGRFTVHGVTKSRTRLSDCTFTFTSLSPYGRKQRITKEPLDESERGE